MNFGLYIPEPIIFNPLKHYLPFIKSYISNKAEEERYPGSPAFKKELKHLGTCVMDIYHGDLPTESIFSEITDFLGEKGYMTREEYGMWAGRSWKSYRIVPLSDDSQWTLKYHEHYTRYVHIFPARSSPYTFRVKANTIKSAIIYLVLIGKDYISDDDLNSSRALAGLSPVKEVADARAVTEMIEILRG